MSRVETRQKIIDGKVTLKELFAETPLSELSEAQLQSAALSNRPLTMNGKQLERLWELTVNSDEILAEHIRRVKVSEVLGRIIQIIPKDELPKFIDELHELERYMDSLLDLFKINRFQAQVIRSSQRQGALCEVENREIKKLNEELRKQNDAMKDSVEL